MLLKGLCKDLCSSQMYHQEQDSVLNESQLLDLNQIQAQAWNLDQYQKLQTSKLLIYQHETPRVSFQTLMSIEI